jgi:hypothetical protein
VRKTKSPAKKAGRKAAKKRAPAKRAAAKRAPVKQRAFLAAYARTGNITAAARAAQCHRSQHYEWLADPAYAEAFLAAQEEAVEALELEARRRAAQGVLKPVYYRGAVCGRVREYSDTLLIFLLKAARPEKYRDNARIEHEVSGAGGGPLTARIDFARLPIERVEELARIGEALRAEAMAAAG